MSKHLYARMLALSAIALIAQGCQSPPRQEQANLGDWYKAQNQPQSTASATPVASALEPEKEDVQPKTKTQEMQTELDIYRNALNSLKGNEANPELVNTLKTKILALEIKKADEIYNESPDRPEIYTPVIANLETWLEENPESPLTQKYKYQLARLQEVTGKSAEAEKTLTALNQTETDTGRQSEVEFRLAEAAFSQRDYDKAITHYTKVLESNDAATASNKNKAIYMRGWSHLQVNEFKQSAQDFLTLLTDPAFSVDNQQMLDDTYRGLILAINDAGGVTEIPTLINLEELQPIAMTLYKRIINFYTAEERWSEVIIAYQAFQDHYPNSHEAIDMALELLSFLESKKQKASLREEKAHFIERYAKAAPKKTATFALELAEYHRAEALEYEKAKQKDWQNLSQASFANSLKYYEFYLNEFSTSPEAPSIKFSYAETLIEAGQIPKARQTLLSLDKESTPAATRQKAAYLAITTLNDQISEMSANQMDVAKLEEEKYQLADKFVHQHVQHPKAESILTWLMVESFKQENYSDALEYTAIAQHNFPKLKQEATQIEADILFAQENWFDAAQAYERLISMTANEANKDEQLQQTWKNNAMKAYYQAARKADKTDTALKLYARVYDSPYQDHELVPAALYEASIIAASAPDDAFKDTSIRLLKRYISQFKDGEQINDAKLKLAEIYVKDKNWALAAPLMQSVAGGIEDPNLKRTAVLEVADLYRKGGNTNKAINAYSSFLQSSNSSTPYADTSKARQALIELYMANGQKPKAYTEMNTYINQNLESKESTQDTRDTALDYAITLAQLEAKKYYRIRLTGNLQASFAQKQAALEKAIDTYKRLERFNTPEADQYVNAGIGDLFNNLSQSLLNAPIPSQLSELEQEEYMMIVEEQAYPFEEKALSSHEKNVTRLHKGEWSQPIENSLRTLRQLMPARFDKQEQFEGAITHVE